MINAKKLIFFYLIIKSLNMPRQSDIDKFVQAWATPVPTQYFHPAFPGMTVSQALQQPPAKQEAMSAIMKNWK